MPVKVPSSEVSEHLPTEEVFCLTGHEGPVLAVRFNSSGTYCLSCGKVLRSPPVLLLMQLRCFACYELCRERNSVLKRRCLQDRTIRLWNPHRGIAIKTYQGG